VFLILLQNYWFCLDYANISTNFRSFMADLFGHLWSFLQIYSVICGQFVRSFVEMLQKNDKLICLYGKFTLLLQRQT